MLALHLDQGQARMIDLPVPIPGPGEALLRPVLAGICNTDLELMRGYYGFSGVPGHEFVALVEKAPGASGWEGRRVTADINIGCGRCLACLQGDPRHCPERNCIGIKNRQGVLAEFVTVPVANLHLIPDGLEDRKAVFAEPLAAALEVSQQIRLTAGLRALVLGDGKLGLLVALGLRTWIPDIALAGKHRDKLSIAARAGVRTLEISSGDGPGGELLEALGPQDLVIEATGRPEGLDLALELVRPEGTIVAKTTSHLPSSLNLARLVVNEVHLLGSRCGNLGLALSHLARGLVDPLPLIQETLPLSRAPEALDAAARPGALKVLVTC